MESRSAEKKSPPEWLPLSQHRGRLVRWWTQPEGQLLRHYLNHLLKAEGERQLGLPANDATAIANAQGRRKILETILLETFPENAQEHLEKEWKKQSNE